MIYIFGDIHGEYDLFMGLLNKLDIHYGTDKIILLGDLMDRGPNSYEVLMHVMKLKEQMKERLVIVRGSHEYMLLKQDLLKYRMVWKLVGKMATVYSFRKHNDSVMKYCDWIEENTAFYHEEENFWCDHAGAKYEDPKKNSEETLLWDHSLALKNEYTGKLVITGHIHLKVPTYFGGPDIGIKELPYNEWMNLPETGDICIDTGCGDGDKPTCMIVNENQFKLMH